MKTIPHTSSERLLTFEVGGAAYALPIAGVLEVAEVAPIACIPTLPLRIGGVINYHGDALPVIRRASLLDLGEAELPEPKHVLVITDRPATAPRLGIPVDRVLGLVEGSGPAAQGRDPVAERQPIGGRVTSVLDPRRLVARAQEVFERSLSHANESRGN